MNYSIYFSGPLMNCLSPPNEVSFKAFPLQHKKNKKKAMTWRLFLQFICQLGSWGESIWVVGFSCDLSFVVLSLSFLTVGHFHQA